MSDAAPSPSLAILVLAGGRASRMGGGDKALLEIAGSSILTRLIARLARPATPMAINANGNPARFAAFGLPVFADAMEDYPGPLAGILAGLDWAATLPGCRDLLSVPGDCPFLPKDLAERLEAARQAAGTPLSCAGSGGWTHPVIGLWPIDLREPLRAALAAGERKIDRFTGKFGCATAQWPTEPFDPFFNVNTHEDLQQARQIALSGR